MDWINSLLLAPIACCVCVCACNVAYMCVLIADECKFANTPVHVGALVSWCSLCVRVSVCVFPFVYLFSWHSLNQWSSETWMSAGLTGREMGECRRGRMDGGERDEYWLISRKIDSQRIMGAFRLSFFFPVANFPGTPIFALLRYEDCSWILEMIYCLICRILMCLYPGVIYWKPLLSLCLIGQAREKYSLIHENCMKPNHI